MERLIKNGDAVNAEVKLSRQKIIRNGGSLALGLFGIFYYRDLSALLAGSLVILLTMYIGVVAYHRLIIHRSFHCPKWLEYSLVFIANFSGMGSPQSLIKIHDLRDWAQRQKKCHSYFCHRKNIFIDGFEQLFCELEMEDPPQFKIELTQEAFYRHMERFWACYQIPLGLILYCFGGLSWVLAGVFLKMFTVQFGHWLIAHFLHNCGEQPHVNRKAGVQGFNIPVLAFLTFGESYHNNHHWHPDAAKNSFRENEIDPAWWLIALFARLGIAKDIKIYET